MGVDDRLFQNLNLKNCTIHFIKWKALSKNESLESYALRLSQQIDQSSPFVMIGVSFGGMLCIEIAKKLNPVKTFLISSTKINKELPFKIRVWRYFPVYKILNDRFFITASLFAKKQFGINSKKQALLFKDMLKHSPKNYFNGAVNCILKWENNIIPDNIVHIHGTADKIIPLKNLTCDYIIKDGTHFMVMNDAAEISTIINKELS